MSASDVPTHTHTSGNKKDNVAIIYTPAKNLKKDGSMDVGQVSFHKDKMVCRLSDHIKAHVSMLNVRAFCFRSSGFMSLLETMPSVSLYPSTECALCDKVAVNRLNKTKRTVVVDHEAELLARQKAEARERKAAAEQRDRQEADLRAQRLKEKEERSYSSLFSKPNTRGNESEDDEKQEGSDLEFM